MFDIAFSELLVIAVVALLVIGPEKLPKVARTVGAFTGRLQRYVTQVKDEINRETRFEELQKLQQEIKESVEHETNALRGIINDTNGHAKKKTEPIAPKKRIKTTTTKPSIPASKITKNKISKAKPFKTKPIKVKIT